MGTHRIPPHTSIADALFPSVRQRVLALLYGNPDRSYFGNEMLTLAQSGRGAVQRELASLADAGLINVSSRGNQKHYQANKDAPVFKELRGLVLKTSGVVDVLRSALAPLAGEIVVAFVFGSISRGQDTATSDVDLMVISDSLAYAELFSALEDAGATLGRTVNPTIYTREEFAKRIKRNNSFATRVLRQNKIWVIGNEGSLIALTA